MSQYLKVITTIILLTLSFCIIGEYNEYNDIQQYETNQQQITQ